METDRIILYCALGANRMRKRCSSGLPIRMLDLVQAGRRIRVWRKVWRLFVLYLMSLWNTRHLMPFSRQPSTMVSESLGSAPATFPVQPLGTLAKAGGGVPEGMKQRHYDGMVQRHRHRVARLPVWRDDAIGIGKSYFSKSSLEIKGASTS